MRRKEKKVIDPDDLESIERDATICHLAMVDDGTPYVVPMNFGFEKGKIFLHCAAEGRKIDILRKNPHVCFEMVSHSEILEKENACKWGTRFKSVIGDGTCRFLETNEEKLHGLQIIMGQYSSRHWEFSAREVESTTVIEIAIVEMNGKISGY